MIWRWRWWRWWIVVSLFWARLNKDIEIPEEKDAVALFKSERHIALSICQTLHDRVVSCSALVFAKNLRMLEYLNAIDRYGDGAWVHIPWPKVSCPHYKLRFVRSFTNGGDGYLEIYSNLTSRAAHSVVAVGPIKVASNLLVILEDPLVKVVWAFSSPSACSTINSIPTNAVGSVCICSFGHLKIF